MAVSHWIEHQTGWSIKEFVRTAHEFDPRPVGRRRRRRLRLRARLLGRPDGLVMFFGGHTVARAGYLRPDDCSGCAL
jgi:hypothetical protein